MYQGDGSGDRTGYPARPQPTPRQRLANLQAVTFGPESIKGAPSSGPGTIDYRLVRQAVISEFRKGRLAQHEVCDAHPELQRAAVHHGEPTARECPICEDANVVLVTYVFGARLPAGGRCISERGELNKLAKRSDQLSCYVVEVCPECAWNHLTRTFLVGHPAG